MNRSRKRKRTLTDNGLTKNEPTQKRIKTEACYGAKKEYEKYSSALIGSVCKVRIILDGTIVDKYFHAKQVLHDIFSSNPPRIDYRRSDKKSPEKSKKQTNLLDYLQVDNDVTSKDDSQICQLEKEQSKLSSADDFVDQNNYIPAYDVNIMPTQPQLVYYMANGQSNNCVLLDNSLVILPPNAQFTPEEFVYNNYGFMPVMGLPIKSEFPENVSVKEEFDDTSINSTITMHDHTINFEDIVTASTPITTAALDGQTIKPCCSDDERKFTPTKFENRDGATCPKSDRSFKKTDAFKQHTLLCGREFTYECSCCEYYTIFTGNMKKHVIRMHKIEVSKYGLDKILKEIRQKRMDKKTLSLMPKVSDIFDSGAEESIVKKVKISKYAPSKLTFDLLCQKCEKSFQRINGIPMKVCPDCKISLVFKCQTCGKILLNYRKSYHHVVNKCGEVSSIYNCEHCDFKTSYKGAIREHIFHRHMKKEKSMFFKCDVCSFQTFYKGNFKRHKRNVHGANETIDLDD